MMLVCRLVASGAPAHHRGSVLSKIRCRYGPHAWSRSCAIGGTPAHQVYSVEQAKDISTLLLMAQSAATTGHLEPGFWRACSLRVQSLHTPSTLHDFSRFVQVAASANYRDDELMYNLGDAVISTFEGEDDKVSSDTLAAVLRAHAALDFKNPRLLERIEAVLLEHLQQSRATTSGISASIHALALLYQSGTKQSPPRDLLEAIDRVALEHLDSFSIDELCDLVEAYALYRVKWNRRKSSLLGQAGSALAIQGESLTARHCSSTLWALAKCRLHDERVVTTTAMRLRNRDVCASLEVSQLSKLLYGLAKFSCQDTALLDILSIEARRRLHLMSLPTLGTVLASLAKTNVFSQVLTSRAAAQIKRTEPEELRQNTLQDLSTTAMAFGKLQLRDRKLFDALGDACLQPVSKLSRDPAELVNIIHAFAKVHFTHAELHRLFSRVIAERFDELTVQDKVKYLHAVAKAESSVPPVLSEKFSTFLANGETAISLGVFELLKLATAARQLGFDIQDLETHIGTILPNESRGRDIVGSGRRTAPPQLRRKSARKRKWTW